MYFTGGTFVRSEAANIPNNACSFMTQSDVLNCDTDKYPDHLIDVLAVVKSFGPFDEYRRENETKTKLKMIITDLYENDVGCVLYDECGTNAFRDKLKDTEKPIIVLLNLARVGFFRGCSFSATRVLFNSDLPEASEMQMIAKSLALPVVLNMSQCSRQSSWRSASPAMVQNPVITPLCEVPMKKTGESFKVNVLVYKLETKHGWLYEGCARCGTQARIDGLLYFAQHARKFLTPLNQS